MTYTVKILAKLIEQGQLGLNQEKTTLLFRPSNPNDPRVKFLAKNTNWHLVRGYKDVLQAAATLENFYILAESQVRYQPTQRVENWHYELAEAKYDPSRESQEGVLFDYQKEAVAFLSFKDRAMLSLSPGLGKTLTSAFAAGLRNFDIVLVVCPASLLYYWKGELEKWADNLPRKPLVDVWHRTNSLLTVEEVVNRKDKQLWIVTNPETVIKRAKEFIGQGIDCMIVDESIMYKHRESQRSQAMKDLAKNFPVVWFLTGAPATKNLDDMWHQFHILKPQGYPSYWRFTRQYCLVDDDVWGSKVIGNRVGAENKIKKNFADIYFSRTQDDVADIPDWIMEDIDIPMLPAQDEAYQTLREELYIRLESVDPNQVITVSNHLSLMIRSIQVASNPLLVGGVNAAGKWDALPELMKVYPGPYIVWVNFIESGKLIQAMLNSHKMRTALANGSTTMEDRNSMVDAFQREEIDAIILNNQVGKFGFTLTKGRTAFFVERMYDDSYFQCLHRNRRIGTTQSPIIVNMRSVTGDGSETIDHLIHDTLDYRVGMIKRVTAADLKRVFSTGKRK